MPSAFLTPPSVSSERERGVSRGVWVDAYTRPITYLRVSITDRCNLRCVYCMPEEGVQFIPAESLLTDDEIIRVVKIAATGGIKKVRLSGGEPLVRKGLAPLIQRLFHVPGLEEVTLTTNGVFLSEQAHALYAAGLRRINISLDTLRPERFARIVRRNLFDRVWEGIGRAASVGFDPIKINVVLQQGINDDEVLDFARLTLDHPYHVRFIEQMPCAQWETWQATYHPYTAARDQMEAEWGTLLPVERESHAGPAEMFRLPHALGQVGFIHAMSHDFCDQCNRMRLTAHGQIRPCLFSEMAVDLLPTLRSGGSDAALSALWYQALRIKPEYHELDSIPQEKLLLTMVNIGG